MFAQEANMHENKFNEYRIPSGMLIVFLEKALTLIHMETHLDDVSTLSVVSLTICLGYLVDSQYSFAFASFNLTELAFIGYSIGARFCSKLELL